MNDRAEMKTLGPEVTATRLLQRLSRHIVDNVARDRLFAFLSGEIRSLFQYDRFSIFLYDSERELLNSFTAADGQPVEAFSNTRIARNTVAWQAIQTRQPVVIHDLTSENRGGGAAALASAGLKATMACPLICGGEIIGTLHCSFARPPANIVDILNFFLALCPLLSAVLFVVLTEERKSRKNEIRDSLSGSGAKTGIHLEEYLLETTDMQEVMSLARKVAKLHIPVLIHGETGTGKSMLARWIHLHSPRRAANFVKVNCPSLAPTLFESEMFGYTKGAFTGAYTKRIGRIEMAQEGSLFLDEIGELSPEMQSKLLHVLEESQFERVGEAVSIPVDIRIISATNINLETALGMGQLRRDLFYRLSTVILRLPPLRRRPGDIPMLVDYYVRSFARSWQISPSRLSRSVLEILCNHDWPGNIRELRNVISRLLLCSLDGKVTESLVHDILYEGDVYTLPGETPGTAPPPSGSQPGPALPSLAENEREHILRVLNLTGGRLAGPNGAAALLGIARSTLQHRMSRLGIAPKTVCSRNKGRCGE